MPKAILDNMTIEEIGQLLKSLNDVDAKELVDHFLDDETKARLQNALKK